MSELYRPIVSWYEGANATANEIKDVVNFGVVDADTTSITKEIWIWNNRDGTENRSKMEEVTYMTRDRQGGTGDTPGANVEAVRDNWFHVRCDTLEETEFTPVGKGNSKNPTGRHGLGTTGSTRNINVDTAIDFATEAVLGLNTFIKGAGDVIFEVTKAGTTGESEPAWLNQPDDVTLSGTVEFTAVPKTFTPGEQEILGYKHKTTADGSNADEAAGNFVKISVYADVPISASAGKNELLQRVHFRYV